jgi:hypothetical protein
MHECLQQKTVSRGATSKPELFQQTSPFCCKRLSSISITDLRSCPCKSTSICSLIQENIIFIEIAINSLPDERGTVENLLELPGHFR